MFLPFFGGQVNINKSLQNERAAEDSSAHSDVTEERKLIIQV